MGYDLGRIAKWIIAKRLLYRDLACISEYYSDRFNVKDIEKAFSGTLSKKEIMDLFLEKWGNVRNYRNDNGTGYIEPNKYGPIDDCVLSKTIVIITDLSLKSTIIGFIYEHNNWSD